MINDGYGLSPMSVCGRPSFSSGRFFCPLKRKNGLFIDLSNLSFLFPTKLKPGEEHLFRCSSPLFIFITRLLPKQQL